MHQSWYQSFWAQAPDHFLNARLLARHSLDCPPLLRERIERLDPLLNRLEHWSDRFRSNVTFRLNASFCLCASGSRFADDQGDADAHLRADESLSATFRLLLDDYVRADALLGVSDHLYANDILCSHGHIYVRDLNL